MTKYKTMTKTVRVRMTREEETLLDEQKRVAHDPLARMANLVQYGRNAVAAFTRFQKKVESISELLASPLFARDESYGEGGQLDRLVAFAKRSAETFEMHLSELPGCLSELEEGMEDVSSPASPEEVEEKMGDLLDAERDTFKTVGAVYREALCLAEATARIHVYLDACEYVHDMPGYVRATKLAHLSVTGDERLEFLRTFEARSLGPELDEVQLIRNGSVMTSRVLF